MNLQGREVVRGRKEGAGDTSPERKNVLAVHSQKNQNQIKSTSKKDHPVATAYTFQIQAQYLLPADTACMFPTQAQYLHPVGIKKAASKDAAFNLTPKDI